MSKSTLARAALAMNAAFSSITGVALLFRSDTISQLLFSQPASWAPLLLLLVGAGLLIFAAGLLLLASDRFVSRFNVLLIVAADIGWVLVSGLFLVFARDMFTATGTLIIAAVAAIVALFAAAQALGSQRITAPLGRVGFTTDNRALVAKVIRPVNAPQPVVWQVMTDHPGYADVASNLSKVEVLSGDGLGMVRKCYGPKSESWAETCDLYTEGREYGFKIHTQADDYPYPISELSGRWAVQAVGGGAEFSIEIKAVPKGGPIMRTLFSLVARRQFKAVLIDLADNWAARMEHSKAS